MKFIEIPLESTTPASNFSTFERQANPNLADSDGWTALTYASRCGSPEAVQALLETLGEIG